MRFVEPDRQEKRPLATRHVTAKSAISHLGDSVDGMRGNIAVLDRGLVGLVVSVRQPAFGFLYELLRITWVE